MLQKKNKKEKKTFTKIQRLFSDDKPSETFNYSRIRPAHRWISNSGYVSLIRVRKDCEGNTMENFPLLTTESRMMNLGVLGQSYRGLVPLNCIELA